MALEGAQDEQPPTPEYQLMRAAWWWIDRWRNSSAFMRMSIEEQGLYRNLLDAVWTFDNHVIPDEHRTLVMASGGDSEAWARGGQKVLQWMHRTDGGWTNETALEVIAKAQSISEKRSKAAAKALAKRWEKKKQSDSKAVANGLAKASHPSPSPSLNNELTENGSAESAPPPPRKKGTKDGPKETPEETAARKAAVGAWVLRFPESKAPGARIWSALKPLVKAHGWATVGANWTRYLAEQDPQFSNPQSFAAKYPWTGNGKRTGGQQTVPAGETEYGPWGIRPKMPDIPEAPPPPKVARPEENPAAAEVWNRVVGAVECTPYQRETWLSQAIPVEVVDPNIVRIWATASVRDYLRGTMREAVKTACEAQGVQLVFVTGGL